MKEKCLIGIYRGLTIFALLYGGLLYKTLKVYAVSTPQAFSSYVPGDPDKLNFRELQKTLTW